MKRSNKVLVHPDLEIELSQDSKGEEIYKGRSKRYEPFEASASSAIECLFQFNIQLAEQKAMAALLNRY